MKRSNSIERETPPSPAKLYSIAHSLPGRIRVKIPALQYEPMLAAGLERVLERQEGVCSVVTSAQSGSVTVEFKTGAFDPLKWFDAVQLEQIPLATPRRIRRVLPAPLAAVRRATFALEENISPPAQFFLGGVSLVATLLGAPEIILSIVLAAAVVPIANRAVQTVLDERRLGAEALDAVSCLVLIRSGSFFPAAVMTSLIGLGEFVRDLITDRCEELIEHQLELSHQSAWLIKGRRRMRIPVVDLRPGDRLVVYPGELISFTGIIEEGLGTVVPATPEMDFEPTTVQVGELVQPETLLTEGKIYARYQACHLTPSQDLVRQKQKKRWLQRTRLHRHALRVGYDRLLPIMGAAALIFAITRDIHRAMTIICFDFITGIRITLPIAVLSSMYKAGLDGVVIRNASTLEKLAKVDVIIFARSGTLTALNPSVSEVHVADGYTLEDVTRFAGAVEQRYSHVAAYAIYSFAKVKRIPVPERISSSVVSGLGVAGNVEGHSIMVGSTRWMKMEKIDLSAAQAFLDKCKLRGDSRACVAIDGKLAGVIAYQDPLRTDATRVVTELRAIGIKEVVMSTGASQDAAQTLATKAGISKVFSRQTAEDKVNLVKEYKSRGHTVAVVGSDVTDSLALELADVAIALGTGAELARHRADVVLDSESLLGLVSSISIARDGMKLARQNLLLVSVPNWLGLGMTLLSGTEVLAATLLNNGSVIIGAANGLRPLLNVERGGREEQEPAAQLAAVI